MTSEISDKGCFSLTNNKSLVATINLQVENIHILLHFPYFKNCIDTE